MPGSGRKVDGASAGTGADSGRLPWPQTDSLMRYHPLPAQMPVNVFAMARVRLARTYRSKNIPTPRERPTWRTDSRLSQFAADVIRVLMNPAGQMLEVVSHTEVDGEFPLSATSDPGQNRRNSYRKIHHWDSQSLPELIGALARNPSAS